MFELTTSIEERRRRLFLRLCKEVAVDQPLYHGSPVEGMYEIMDAGRLYVQGHGELVSDFFCVSANDNMLRSFSDGDALTGMAFVPPRPLRCIQLDPVHYALAASESMGWYNAVRVGSIDEHTAERARILACRFYDSVRGDPYMSACDFERVIPEWCDGLLFPWSVFHWGELWPSAHNDECEIALTQRGTDQAWQGMHLIYLQGKEYDPKDGWRHLRRRRKKRAQEVRHLQASAA